MTIAIAVQVHDGIVLASDSATTLIEIAKPGPDNVLNVYNNANKIFNLRKGLPIGGMTYGMGSIGTSSISTLAKDLRQRFAGRDKHHPDWHVDAENFTIEDIAGKARQLLFEEKYKPLGIAPSPGVQFGFIVAGYSSQAELSEAWAFEFVNGDCAPPRRILAPGDCMAYAAGDPEAFSRLVLGYSQRLGEALVKIGLNPADLPAAIEHVKAELHTPLVEAPMPIQDTIDFAEFLVHTTSMFTRFKRGAATVGGPVESAAITKHEGFKWVRRKHYFDTVLNPPGGDE